METHPAHSALAYPPLDGSLLLHELPDFHLHHNASHPLFVYAEHDQEFLHKISHLEFCRAVHRVAHAVDHIPRTTPVGVLVLTDTILYHAVFFGLMKAGHTVSCALLRPSPASDMPPAISPVTKKFRCRHSQTSAGCRQSPPRGFANIQSTYRGNPTRARIGIVCQYPGL